MQKISVTRALVELKRYDQRIAQSISSGVFVGVVQGKADKAKVVGVNKSVEEMSRAILGSYDSVNKLIENRAALKSAIVLSNATTVVQVLGKSMTVAEAIEMKATVSHRENYLYNLRAQFTQAKLSVDKGNTALDESIEKLLTAIYGSDKTKIDASSYETVAGPQKQVKELRLLDPANIEAKIQELQEEVQEIRSEIDFVLSESNARTTVEVEI